MMIADGWTDSRASERRQSETRFENLSSFGRNDHPSCTMELASHSSLLNVSVAVHFSNSGFLNKMLTSDTTTMIYVVVFVFRFIYLYSFLLKND